MKEYIGIKNATSKGYLECEIGGVADFLYPTSKHRRGRVQQGGADKPYYNRRKYRSVQSDNEKI